MLLMSQEDDIVDYNTGFPSPGFQPILFLSLGEKGDCSGWQSEVGVLLSNLPDSLQVEFIPLLKSVAPCGCPFPLAVLTRVLVTAPFFFCFRLRGG